MSINVSTVIRIKTNDVNKLRNELIEKEEKDHYCYLNYDIFENNKIDKYIKEHPVYVSEENDNCLRISIEGNKFFYPFEMFFKKYGKLVTVSVYDDYDQPEETGLPFLNEHYYYLKNNKICNESQLDRVLSKIKKIIKDNDDLYSYLFNLCELYYIWDNDYTEDFFNKQYDINKDSSYDELLINLCVDIPMLFKLVSDKAKNNKEIIKKLLMSNPKIFHFIDKYKDDEELMSIFLSYNDLGNNISIKEKDNIKLCLEKILDKNHSFLKKFLSDYPLCYDMVDCIVDVDKYLDINTYKKMIKKFPGVFHHLNAEYRENLELVKLYLSMFIKNMYYSHKCIDKCSSEDVCYKNQLKMNFDKIDNIKDIYLYIINFDNVCMQNEILYLIPLYYLKDEDIVYALIKTKLYKDNSLFHLDDSLINLKFMRKIFKLDLDFYNRLTYSQLNNEIAKKAYLECGGIIEEEKPLADDTLVLQDEEREFCDGDLSLNEDDLPF